MDPLRSVGDVWAYVQFANHDELTYPTSFGDQINFIHLDGYNHPINLDAYT